MRRILIFHIQKGYIQQLNISELGVTILGYPTVSVYLALCFWSYHKVCWSPKTESLGFTGVQAFNRPDALPVALQNDMPPSMITLVLSSD